MDYLKGLNESQYEAVTTIQGPLMVLAWERVPEKPEYLPCVLLILYKMV